jgi:hypothetical protein
MIHGTDKDLSLQARIKVIEDLVERMTETLA